MWNYCINRCYLTSFSFVCAILFINICLINTEIINGDNSLETNLTDLMPNENTTINSNETSLVNISSIEEEEVIENENTTNTPPNSTTQIKEDQNNILDNKQTISTLEIPEEITETEEYNIKHEISNPPVISAIESQITESSNTHFSSVTHLVPLDMDELPIVKVQKCCPKGEIMVVGQAGKPGICQQSNEIFDIPVFCANLTNYWNCTTTAASNIEIVPRDPCKQRFFLDPMDENDTFRLLSNSSLYIPFSMDMLNINQYCVDTIKGPETTFTTAIICTAPPPKFTYIFDIIYLTGLSLSIVLLFLLAIYSSRRTDIKDEQKKCFTFFASSMATALLFELIQTIVNSYFNYFNYSLNIMILYLIYYLKLNYYLWLNILSFDTYIFVRNSTIDTKSYMKWYLIVTFSIPFILMCFSFIGGCNPPLPYKYSWYKNASSYISVICLYIGPVALSSLGNIIVICSISLPKERYKNVKDLVATLQSKNWKAPPRNIRELKRMYFRSCALFIIICVCFILDVTFFFVQAHFFIQDGIYCLQGALITCLFLKKCWSNKSTRSYTNNDVELTPIANGNA